MTFLGIQKILIAFLIGILKKRHDGNLLLFIQKYLKGGNFIGENSED